MRAGSIVSLLIMLLCPLLFAACTSLTGAPADPYELTPVDTSASTLSATVNIVEDQNATDGMSNITVQFKTALVEEDNYIRFDDQETIVCNSVRQKLSNAPTYLLKVARGNYLCQYTGNQKGVPLLPVSMINVEARSLLSPQPPQINQQKYTITYTADTSAKACKIMAEAVDNNGNSIDGPLLNSNLGIYSGPLSNALSGTGNILLKRTCSWKSYDTFDPLNVTYQSLASVEVTWSH
jgi:hypothetical protein